MLKEVIRIDSVVEPKKELNPIEFTHFFHNMKGWIDISETTITHKNIGNIVYLGKDAIKGDMFTAYDGEFVRILKGHLNDGVYES
jgi:hypothetical protein